ncbi:hypothetical protein F4775DRAFT_549818 [Biscogniauxia sp. FL1348]|nr:hypothetical protein F4775DRAFT_549818 [Biscogniauxia sp. FL1348]
MPTLPAVIYKCILSFTSPDTQRSCRLVSKTLCSIATPIVFHHICLEAAGDASQFINIAKSETLRSHVREISINTWVGPQFQYLANEPFEPPAIFFRAIPFLGVFSSLKKLNLKFSEHCGKHRDIWDDTYEEDYDFRYWVMWTVFSSLTGEWDAVTSQDIYEDMDAALYESGEQVDGEDFFESLGKEMEAWPQLSPIKLEALTIGNLADYNDIRLTSSELFKKVLHAPSLTELYLYVVFEENKRAPEKYTRLTEKYHFMDSLGSTWLAPEVAKKLRILSLFCEDYWGWSPKIDFRKINPGPGPDAGLPKLEVLALGNFVFSSCEGQADWFASLGHRTDRGGLQELYLDNCPIIYAAHTYDRLDVGPDGDYSLLSAHNAVSDEVDKLFSTRWHELLTHWADNMNGLKVLKIGRGEWRTSSIPDLIFNSRTPEIEGFSQERIEQRFSRTNFITYNCSPPPDSFVDIADLRKVTYGLGISEDITTSLTYVQFHVGYLPTHWLDGNVETELAKPEELDNQAWCRIRRVIDGRRGA